MSKKLTIQERITALVGQLRPEVAKVLSGPNSHTAKHVRKLRAEQAKRKGIKSVRIPTLKRTAYHEAGHAVMAYLLRRRCKEVSIIPADDGSLGHVGQPGEPDSFHPDYESDSRTRDRIERQVMIYLAGHVAECRLAGKDVSIRRAGAGDDYSKAVGWADWECGTNEEAGAYVTWLLHRTKNKLSVPFHWSAVEALASELLAQKTIGWTNARKIIKAAILGYAQKKSVRQRANSQEPHTAK